MRLTTVTVDLVATPFLPRRVGRPGRASQRATIPGAISECGKDESSCAARDDGSSARHSSSSTPRFTWALLPQSYAPVIAVECAKVDSLSSGAASR
jgi:hypothetical protein